MIAVLLSVLILTASITWFLWHELTTVESTLRDAHVVILEVGLTAKNLREASTVWKKASQDQSSAILSATQNVSAAAKQLSVSASAVEKSSTALLSELTRDANEQSAQLLLNQKQLQTNLQEIQGATTELRQGLKDLDAQVSNSAIGETLAHIDQASQNAANALDETQKTVKNVRLISDKARETYLKPVNLWWGLVKELLPLAGSAAQVIK